MLLVPLLLLATAAQGPAIPAPYAAIAAGISAGSLRDNLKYLSSDELEGRGTPSAGQDKASEFIAKQFKSIGLQPIGTEGYFQTGSMSEKQLTRIAERRGVTLEQIKAFRIRNVVGVLPGTDPKLRDTYILVTAHYDHLGTKKGEGDTIFNGANDDGSGTVSVIEVAKALKGLKLKRSVLFMTFYGEELGLLGSQFYGAHPLVPLEKTVADINLEQVGRTDDTEGPRVSAVSITGEDYSDIGKLFEVTGPEVGIKVEKHPQFSDMYFFASDNAALAMAGVPAHTVCTAFEYPDYHGLADTWDKIDYENMAKVDRFVALSVAKLADSDKAPKWNADNPKTARYRKARGE